MFDVKREARLLGLEVPCVYLALRDSSSGIRASLQEQSKVWSGVLYSHSTISPLRFFQYVQTRVDDELVHILRCLREAEAGNAITTPL